MKALITYKRTGKVEEMQLDTAGACAVRSQGEDVILETATGVYRFDSTFVEKIELVLE